MNKLALTIVIPLVVVSLVLGAAFYLKMRSEASASLPQGADLTGYSLDTNVTRPSGSYGTSGKSSGSTVSSLETDIKADGDDGGQADINALKGDASGL